MYFLCLFCTSLLVSVGFALWARRQLYVLLQRRLSSVGLLAICGIKPQQLQENLHKMLHNWFAQSQVQSLLESKMSTFLEREFSILSKLVSKHFLTKLSTQVQHEILHFLSDEESARTGIPTSFLSDKVMQEIDTVLGKRLLDTLYRHSTPYLLGYSIVLSILLTGLHLLCYFFFLLSS